MIELSHPQEGVLRADIGDQIIAYLRFLYSAIPCHVSSRPPRVENPLSMTRKARA